MNISTLDQYISIINDVSRDLNIVSPKTLWFRGQSDETWNLLPSIYRGRNLNYFEREMTRDFRLMAGELLTHKPQSELEWMFVMQHHGLPTRLLDWTESSLIALFFAVVEYDNAQNAAVWVLRPAKLNLAVMGEVTITTTANPFLDNYVLGPSHLKNRTVTAQAPAAIRPERNSRRILAQKGGFTLHGSSVQPLNHFVEEKNESILEKMNNNDYLIPLRKLIVSGFHKKDLLRELSVAGITYSVIFPEVQGMCSEIKMKYASDFTMSVDLADLRSKK